MAEQYSSDTLEARDETGLPIPVQRLGNATVAVFELPQHSALTPRDVLRLGRVLGELFNSGALDPNNGEGIDKVVDLETYLKHKMTRSEAEIMKKYGVESFDFSAKFLHETGRYGFDDHQDEQAEKYLEDIVALIELKVHVSSYNNGEITLTIEDFSDLVRDLGGFDKAVALSQEQVHYRLDTMRQEPEELSDDDYFTED